MVSKCLYLPKTLFSKVDKYASLRGISRNVAFEELLKVAFYGEEKASRLLIKESLNTILSEE